MEGLARVCADWLQVGGGWSSEDSESRHCLVGGSKRERVEGIRAAMLTDSGRSRLQREPSPRVTSGVEECHA